MNRLPALLLFSALASHSLLAEIASTSPSENLKELPGIKESTPTPEIKASNLTKSSEYTAPSPAQIPNAKTTYTKEQQEALDKERNWAVEGLKERREAQRLEMEKLQENEKTSLDELLEKERKSIDERMGKPSTPLGQFKPSIETNWSAVNGQLTSTERELAAKKEDLQALEQLQDSWTTAPLLNGSSSQKDTSPNFGFSQNSNTASPTSGNAVQNSLQNLQNQLDGTKVKAETNFDHLVNTGQAQQNFRKLSSDPNYQPPVNGPLSNPTFIDGVPSVPKPVTSTMSVETLRQIELQRVNAIPKPDFREINSRIPDPGTRRF